MVEECKSVDNLLEDGEIKENKNEICYPSLAVNENANTIWGHAQPAEPIIKKREVQAELDFMKDLFLNKLPLGENKEHIEEYFNRLETLIDTKDYDGNINREQFTDDVPGANYRYFSSTSARIRASGHALLSDGQGMDSSSTNTDASNEVQDVSEEFKSETSFLEHS